MASGKILFPQKLLIKIENMKNLDIAFFATILGTAFSLSTFLIPAKWKSKRLTIISVVFVLTLLSSIITFQYTKLARIERISNSAEQLLKDKEMHFTDEAFIQASLTFLEANKDIYPDSYERANILYSNYKNAVGTVYTSSLASEFSGLIKGIQILNK